MSTPLPNLQQKPNSNPPEDPQQFALLEQTLLLMGELIKLLNYELELVSQQDTKKIQELLPQKHRLINQYQANIKALSQVPDMIKAAPKALRDELTSTAKKLAVVSQTNQDTLHGAMNAVRRVIDYMMRTLREEVGSRYQTYRDHRTSHLALGLHSSVVPAVAYNRTA